MDSYSPETTPDLRDCCREAAASLVAEGGWDALTVRECEKRALLGRGKFRDLTIHEMQVMVVEAAFIEIAIALDAITNTTTATRREIYFVLASHLENDEDAAALITQVSAVMAAKSGKLYKALQPSIQAWTSKVLAYAEGFFVKVEDGDIADESVWRARDMLRWYYAAAVTRVTDPETGRGQLLSLAVPEAIWR